jgi:hypothetical protein
MLSFLDPDGASLGLDEDGSFHGDMFKYSGHCSGTASKSDLDDLADALTGVNALRTEGAYDQMIDSISFDVSIAMSSGEFAGMANAFRFVIDADRDFDALGYAILAILEHAYESGDCS